MLKNFGEIASKSYFYLIYTCTYGAEKHITCERFENAPSKAKVNVIATVHFADDDVSFYDGPGMLICKTTKPCINNTWIVLLIHGFVLVKTWLSIAWDTAFYAIMKINCCMLWLKILDKASTQRSSPPVFVLIFTILVCCTCHWHHICLRGIRTSEPWKEASYHFGI